MCTFLDRNVTACSLSDTTRVVPMSVFGHPLWLTRMTRKRKLSFLPTPFLPSPVILLFPLISSNPFVPSFYYPPLLISSSTPARSKNSILLAQKAAWKHLPSGCFLKSEVVLLCWCFLPTHRHYHADGKSNKLIFLRIGWGSVVECAVLSRATRPLNARSIQRTYQSK